MHTLFPTIERSKHITAALLAGASLATAFALGGCATPAATDKEVLTTPQIAAIVSSPDRTDADRNSDAGRKPAQMLAFIGVRPGMKALDLNAAGGYTTELLARAVGPSGQVFGQSPPPRDAGTPALPPATPEGGAMPARSGAMTAMAARPLPSPQALAVRAQKPAVVNIVPLVRPFEHPAPPELATDGLDLVTLMFNYHDLAHWNVDRAQMNKALFSALKPGGIYVIADHAGRSGTGVSESGTLHRIEEAFLINEVEAAGFKLADEAYFLHNPADPRDKNTPDNGQFKDEFIVKFIKP
jgi:predicted methyltransferase